MSDNELEPIVEVGTKAATQKFKSYGRDVEDEGYPPLRQMVFCESKLRAGKLKTRYFNWC